MIKKIAAFVLILSLSVGAVITGTGLLSKSEADINNHKMAFDLPPNHG